MLAWSLIVEPLFFFFVQLPFKIITGIIF
jgi:hypothetical protein